MGEGLRLAPARLAGLRLALTTLTVLRLRPGRVDRRTAGRAAGLFPAVGLALGGVAAAVLVGVRGAGGPPLLGGALAVAALAVATRGLHLDGLADTADGLGSYADRERALQIMREPAAGPFGVAAVCLALLVQASALAALASHPLRVVLGVAAGRLAATWLCRRGIPAARPDGLGVLVAGSVPIAVPLLWTAVLLVGAVDGWPSPTGVLAGLGLAGLLGRQAVRRLGGITGDVLGAAVEVATSVALAVATLG